MAILVICIVVAFIALVIGVTAGIIDLLCTLIPYVLCFLGVYYLVRIIRRKKEKDC